MFENEIAALLSNPLIPLSVAFFAVCLSIRLVLTGLAKIVQSVVGKKVEVYNNEVEDRLTADMAELRRQIQELKKPEQVSASGS